MQDQPYLSAVGGSNYLTSSAQKLDAVWLQAASIYLQADTGQIQHITQKIETLVWARLVDLASRRSGRVMLMQLMDDLRSWGLQHKRLEFFQLDQGIDLNLGLRLTLKCFGNRFSNVVQTIEVLSNESAATVNSLISAVTPICIGVLIEEMVPSKHLSEEQWAEDLVAQKESIRQSTHEAIDLAHCLGGIWDDSMPQPATGKLIPTSDTTVTERSKKMVWLLLILAAASISFILWKYH
jgi:hypothetical protein